MNIRERSEIKSFARQRLAGNQEEKKLILIYAGVSLGLALLVTVVNYVLGLRIDQTGGLRNMSTRAVLDTIRQILPMAQSILLLCLELGYMAAMLRIARGQYVSAHTLKLGFDRFWPLLRLTLLRGLIFLAAGIISIYLGTITYMLTPLSEPVMELLEPVVSGVTALDTSLVLDDLLYSQLLRAMIPCFLLCGGFCLLLGLPLWYRYRLAAYVLIDKPAFGAMKALRESRLLMYKNRLAFFRLDLSLWFYHVPMFVVGLLAYGDVLLEQVGISLPVSETVGFFGFYLLYLICQFALYFFLRNGVEVSYCLAYDSLLPKEPTEGGVILGNIFQM